MLLFTDWSLLPKAQTAPKSYKLAPHWDQRIVFSLCNYLLGELSKQMRLFKLSLSSTNLSFENKWWNYPLFQKGVVKSKRLVLCRAVWEQGESVVHFFYVTYESSIPMTALNSKISRNVHPSWPVFWDRFKLQMTEVKMVFNTVALLYLQPRTKDMGKLAFSEGVKI